jgi:hypothetical protein
MKAFKYFILVVFIIANSNLLLSQAVIYGNDDNYQVKQENIQSKDQATLNKQKSKLSYNIDIGSSFTTSKYYGNMLAFYTSPSLKYSLSPSFNLHAGVMLINTNMSSNYLNENQNKKNYSAYFMTGFDYTKEKLRITGEILYGKNKMPYSLGNNRNTPEYFARFSAEYKITDNLSIGVQVINQNMNQNYFNPYGYQYNNPYQRYNPYLGF